MNSTAVALLESATGLFFTVTGCRKVFLPDVRARVLPFIQRTAKVPRPMAWGVILGELAGGLGLLLGILPGFAAAGLLPIMAGAYLSDTLPTVRAKQAGKLSVSQFISNALCTPEAQLIVILLALVAHHLF